MNFSFSPSFTESRREWILKQFADADTLLTRITHCKGWQNENHPAELSTKQMINEHFHSLHYNPVEAGIVWETKDYYYSSAIDYAGGKGYLDVELIR